MEKNILNDCLQKATKTKPKNIQELFDLYLYKHEELDNSLIIYNEDLTKEQQKEFDKTYEKYKNEGYITNKKNYKTKNILESPDDLLIFIDRLYHNTNGKKSKTTIKFDINDFLQVHSDNYKLKGYILHSGSINSGHYTVNVLRKGNKWYSISDENVKEIQKLDLKDNKDVIALLYSKNENIEYPEVQGLSNKGMNYCFFNALIQLLNTSSYINKKLFNKLKINSNFEENIKNLNLELYDEEDNKMNKINFKESLNQLDIKDLWNEIHLKLIKESDKVLIKDGKNLYIGNDNECTNCILYPYDFNYIFKECFYFKKKENKDLEEIIRKRNNIEFGPIRINIKEIL